MVLPLLGAVPDGAIMLFSGLGDIEEAQETLSVGVGALAGSTIMLLTIPWALSIVFGRVNIVDGTPVYKPGKGKSKVTPDLSFEDSLDSTGIIVNDAITEGAKIMIMTTIPYFLIQLPATYLEDVDPDNISAGEKSWALLGLIVCLVGFVSYLIMQYNISKKGENAVIEMKTLSTMKKVMDSGKFSLSGVLADLIGMKEGETWALKSAEYGSTDGSKFSMAVLPTKVQGQVKELLHTYFHRYDTSGDGLLDQGEIFNALKKDLNETSITAEDVNILVGQYDADGSGALSFDEFCSLALDIVKKDFIAPAEKAVGDVIAEDAGEESEEEKDVPEELAHLSPAEQQRAIKKRAFTMLAIGTIMVLVFSDPMVDVMQEMANRVGISAFYVSFVLAPLASNASEVLASAFYASKKTSSSITISLSALEGAAAMNNTFCLSIFMGLIYFRGLAWQYTAETIAIVLVQFILAAYSAKKVLTTRHALAIISLFPLSIIFVYVLEKFGLD